MQSKMLLNLALLLLVSLTWTTPALFAQTAPAGTTTQTGSPVSAAKQTPEQYLRALYYRGDRLPASRDGEELATGKGASLESRAWLVGLRQRDGDQFKMLTILASMRAETPEDPWTLATRVYFTSEIEQAIWLCERAVSKSPREDILLFCTIGVSGQVQTVADGDVLKRFLERNRQRFEASALGLVTYARALGAINRTVKKRYSDETTALYDRALQMEPGNTSALSGKMTELVARGRTAEAAELFDRHAAQINSESLHLQYSRILRTFADLDKEERARRIEADARSLLEKQEPSADFVSGTDFNLRGLSGARADALTDLILQRYPNSQAAERAAMNRIVAKVDRQNLGSASTEVKNEVVRRLLDFLKRPGMSASGTRFDAVSWLMELTHYTDFSTAQLFEAVKSTPSWPWPTFVMALAARKAHLPELEQIAAGRIEELIREAKDYSSVWNYDDDSLDFRRKAFWRELGTWEEALGWIHLQQGRVTEAESKLLTAERLISTELSFGLRGTWLDREPGTLSRLGRLYAAKGNYAKAEEYLTRASNAEYFHPDEHPAIAAYKDLYLRQHRDAAGLDQYLAGVYEKDKARRKKLILKDRIVPPQPIPPFKLKTIEGKTISSEELKGKFVVINFWGTWCGPCLAEIAEVQMFHDKYKGNPDIVFLTIDARDSLAQVKSFMAERKYTFPVLMDDEYVDKTDLKGFPTTWFLDRDGKKVFEKVGTTKRLLDEFSWRVEGAMESQAAGTGAASKPQ